jgi:16S rRNA (guanine1207-N2)-methyltransferase
LSEAIRALMLPFSQGLLPLPEPGAGLLIRAETGPGPEWTPLLVCEQSLKPVHDQLRAAGFRTVITSEGSFGTVLYLMTRQKAETLGNLGRAWDLLAPGGRLVVAGDNDIGAATLIRAMQGAFGLDGQLSKYHCRVAWTTKPLTDAPQAPPEWRAADRLAPQADGRFLTRPGLFAWDRIDLGSQMLVQCLPADLAGKVADAGAGWGWLSISALEKCPRITALDLFEAEHRALEAARANLSTVKTAATLGFHWHDVTAGLPQSRHYDAILMNPPFHISRSAEPDIGRAFIAAASKALKSGGRLFLVANRQLPYEAALTAGFRRFESLRDEAGFKVLMAVR